MSYILDALRKSDQQRQRGATPTLLTAQESAAEPKQFAYLIYGLIAAVLVGAGIVIGWLHPRQSEPPAGEIIPVKPLDSGPRRSAPAPVTPGRSAPSLSNAQTRGAPPKAVATAPTEALTPVPEKTINKGTTGLSDPAQEQRVMTMGELPLSIRQELPGMQISVHLYSTRPKNSFVSINSQMLQEGEDLAPGMIFSYKGYRFRRGVQQ